MSDQSFMRHYAASLDTVTNPLCISSGDFHLDGMGVYDADTGALVSITANCADIALHTIEEALAMLNATDAGTWADDLDAATLADLVGAACSDALADYGDWQRDMAADGHG